MLSYPTHLSSLFFFFSFQGRKVKRRRSVYLSLHYVSLYVLNQMSMNGGYSWDRYRLRQIEIEMIYLDEVLIGYFVGVM